MASRIRISKDYNDASGNPLFEEGQVCAPFIGRDEKGKREALTSVSQVAEVQRPPLSISRMLHNIEDEEVEVIFKRKEAFVRCSRGKTLARAERRGGLRLGMYALETLIVGFSSAGTMKRLSSVSPPTGHPCLAVSVEILACGDDSLTLRNSRWCCGLTKDQGGGNRG